MLIVLVVIGIGEMTVVVGLLVLLPVLLM